MEMLPDDYMISKNKQTALHIASGDKWQWVGDSWVMLDPENSKREKTVMLKEAVGSMDRNWIRFLEDEKKKAKSRAILKRMAGTLNITGLSNSEDVIYRIRQYGREGGLLDNSNTD
ncbi:hypothetical protein CYMTET_51552 [Cymbomonas tetramitiformis]|uniref:Uncharacterized protein n=1 Tax=Cymbomonas tetramitiformis TaxID=36881 RepID=A0AAE0ESI6_9CHLO|nr:hypothetical protein CYMTET_51552 [Cymbomonas tetramitiformis]